MGDTATADRESRGPARSVDELIGRLTRELLDHGTLFSEATYRDQPILRTGSDLARARAAARAAEGPSRGNRDHDARDGRGAGERPAAQTPQGTSAGARANAGTRARSRAGHGASATPLPSPASQASRGWREAADPWAPRHATAPLTPTLRALRDLEHSRDEQGERLRGGALFCAQARLAADYEDDLPYAGYLPYRYLPTYQELSDAELRGYFTWRTSWRRGTALGAPSTYATLLAFELVNGVGASTPEEAHDALVRLAAFCRQKGEPGGDAGTAGLVSSYARDYAIVNGINVSAALGPGERAFCAAVTTLRQAEDATLAALGLRGRTPEDAPAMPADADVLAAMGEVSTLDAGRSPLFRAHPDAAAAVAADVFRRMAEHCARRRKRTYVDSLVGEPTAGAYYPFVGVPTDRANEGRGPDRTLRLAPGATMSYRFGRWTRRLPYAAVEHSRDLARLLRAIDRQMRLDWDFGRPLKEQPLPKYQERLVVEACAAERAREQEAERRRFVVDLSQLGHIRAAAATTREALLIDEEREGYVPDAPMVAAAGSAGGDEAAQGEGSNGAAQGAGLGQRGGQSPHASAPTRGDDGTANPITAPAADPTVPGPNPAAAPYPAAAGDPTASGPAASAPTDTDAPAPSLGLDAQQLAVLRALLSHEDPRPLVTPGGPTLDMIVDAINDRLIDLVGDIAVDYGDDGPRVVEDYENDLRGMVLP